MKARQVDDVCDTVDPAPRDPAPVAARRNPEQKRVNVDFPVWMIRCLDREAKRLGVPRQSLIKVWIAEKLQALPDET